MKITFNLIGLMLLCSPFNIQGLSFTIRDLDTLATDRSSVGGINNHNVIVGNLSDHDTKRDFIWDSEKKLTDLPFTPTYQLPLINNHNQIVGIFWHQTNNWFFENKYSKHIYLLSNDGSIKDIGAPSKWKSQILQHWQTRSVWDDKALAIIDFNDQGQILIANASEISKASEFAIWDNGEFQYIDSIILSTAYGMNNQGIILGRKWVANEEGNIPMLVLYDFKNNIIQEIMEDVNLVCKRLNDRGQVIVTQLVKNQDKKPAVKGSLWDQEKGLIPLDEFLPLAINNCNQMIGIQLLDIESKKHNPLFWNNGEIINLKDCIGIWGEIEPKKINDNGYITGEGFFDGKKHAFVLIPKED
jgi:hypothetical protein